MIAVIAAIALFILGLFIGMDIGYKERPAGYSTEKYPNLQKKIDEIRRDKEKDTPIDHICKRCGKETTKENEELLLSKLHRCPRCLKMVYFRPIICHSCIREVYSKINEKFWKDERGVAV